MKKQLLTLLTICFIISSCGKDEDKINPIASFTSERSSYYLTEPALFINTSTDAASVEWDFGDNTTSTESSPSHTYQSAGTFNVTLKAGTSTFQKKIKVNIGSYSYQLKNETTLSFPLSSYYYDGSVKDLINHGTVMVNGVTDTVFTNRDKIELAGTLNGQTFIVVDSYPLSKFSNKILIINGSTRIYTGASGSSAASVRTSLNRQNSTTIGAMQ